MNIKLTYNWILDYLETNCNPYDFAKYLSLCGPSFERIEKKGDDFIFDIEITSNRIDVASAFGIAQEAAAILPTFNIKALLKNNPLNKYFFPKVAMQKDNLDVKILDSNLCSRFSAIIFENIKIQKSEESISKRLDLCGIKTINNVVDISNYIMLTIGQPCHIFDYDKMKDHKMILRKSKKGEKIQLLDNSIINLPGGDIVIEDGSKKLVDLCGIMGGLNSSVTYETKKIILFIQTYNKQNIRKTSMQTGIRTIAATYFEKGLDEERVETGIGLGIELLEKYANAKISSKVIDIYPSIHKPIKILFSNKKVNKLIGIEISKDKQLKILNDLGFKIDNNPTYITVPFWRKNDIKEHNDLIEEVARIYGYFNLPSQLQSFTHVVGEKTIEDYFRISGKIKNILKSIGLNENINYSMVSEKLLNYFNLKKEEHLKIINPISKDMEFLRKSIIPSLVQNIKSNEVKKEDLRFFEISKVFNKRNSELPDEIYKLGIATNTSYYDLKGIMERILHELNIFKYELSTVNKSFFSEKQSACLKINNYPCIYLGRLKPEITQRFGILKNVYICEIDLLKLIENYKHLPRYKKPISYAVIKLDLTAKIKSYEEFKNQAFLLSKELINIKVKDIYKDNITLRFYFSNRAKNITEKEALEELDKIKKIIK